MTFFTTRSNRSDGVSAPVVTLTLEVIYWSPILDYAVAAWTCRRGWPSHLLSSIYHVLHPVSGSVAPVHLADEPDHRGN